MSRHQRFSVLRAKALSIRDTGLQIRVAVTKEAFTRAAGSVCSGLSDAGTTSSSSFGFEGVLSDPGEYEERVFALKNRQILPLRHWTQHAKVYRMVARDADTSVGYR